MRTIVNIILNMFALSTERFVVPFLAAAGLSTAPAEAAAPGPARAPAPIPLFDGGRAVEVRRVDARALTWAGVRVGYDQHALVWLADPEAGPEVFARLEVQPVSWASRTLGLVRVRGEASEDGLDVARRLQPAVGRELRGALPDLRIPHRAAQIDVPPDDPRYPAQWFFERIGLEGAWQLATGSEDVTIVVVDNGCDADHPDLAEKLDPGRDVVDGDDDPAFEPGVRGNEHGTACAGLVGAATDNGLGIAGACPACRVRCVRMLTDDPGGTPLSADVAAFQFALDVGADVVSNSWGFVGAVAVPEPLRAIIETLLTTGRDGAGTVVVFAAGNDNRTIGEDELQAIPGIITVGATNNFDEATPFSNRGRSVDVVAPTGTLATDIAGPDGQSEGDYTSFFGGTSSACPLVAGIAGLLVGADPAITASEVRDLLTATAEQSFFATPGPDGHDLLYGYGIVRPEAALRAQQGRPPATPDAGAADGGRDAGAAGTWPDADGSEAGGGDAGAVVPSLVSDPDGCTSAPGHLIVALPVLVLAAARGRRRPPLSASRAPPTGNATSAIRNDAADSLPPATPARFEADLREDSAIFTTVVFDSSLDEPLIQPTSNAVRQQATTTIERRRVGRDIPERAPRYSAGH